MSSYTVNEVFYSIQGEGIRAGTANIFVRFTGCNLRCDVKKGPKSPGGFACDTEFESGRAITREELLEWVEKTNPDCRWIIFTGGEPALQVDDALCSFLHNNDYSLAIETNGTKEVCSGIDWITLSPKVAEHAVKCMAPHEIKYVRGYGQSIPKPRAVSLHKLISPAFDGGELDSATIEWCVNLVKENPEWRLSVQNQKFWNER